MQTRSEKESLFRENKWKHLQKHSFKEKKHPLRKKNTDRVDINCHFSFMKVEAKFQLASYGCSLKKNKWKKLEHFFLFLDTSL